MKQMLVCAAMLALIGIFFTGSCYAGDSLIERSSRYIKYVSNIGNKIGAAVIHDKDKPAVYAMPTKGDEDTKRIKGICVSSNCNLLVIGNGLSWRF